MPTLEELHNAYMSSREPEENFNYNDNSNPIEENEFSTIVDEDFKKHIAKLKWMKEFNSGRSNR